MHRLDQLPLVVRLPLENDLSWIVLADEIYRACLCRIIGIETRARFRSLLNTETGEGELAARQHVNYIHFGDYSICLLAGFDEIRNGQFLVASISWLII